MAKVKNFFSSLLVRFDEGVVALASAPISAAAFALGVAFGWGIDSLGFAIDHAASGAAWVLTFKGSAFGLFFVVLACKFFPHVVRREHGLYDLLDDYEEDEGDEDEEPVAVTKEGLVDRTIAVVDALEDVEAIEQAIESGLVERREEGALVVTEKGRETLTACYANKAKVEG